jgi:hypothetical protein
MHATTGCFACPISKNDLTQSDNSKPNLKRRSTMRISLLTLGALLAIGGTSVAGEISGWNSRYGDAAPPSVIVIPPPANRTFGYSTTRSFHMAVPETPFWNSRYGDAAPPSVIVIPPSANRAFGYSGTRSFQMAVPETPFWNSRYGDAAPPVVLNSRR